jgi:ribokinase
MVDLITYVTRMPGPGETIEAPRFAMGCGGKGANQAVAAAQLGASVVMVSKVGDDIFGDNTIRNFQRYAIDTHHVEKVTGVSSGVAPIFVEPSGENSILIIKGANDTLVPADIDRAAADLESCDLILLQLEIPLETIYYAIAFARRHAIETLLNPAPASRDLDLGRISDTTFLVPNETELAILTNLPVGSLAEIEAAAQRLIASGIRTVIVTMGARGALLVTARGSQQFASVKVVPKDTTGAGDAFIGSFAAHYAESRSVEPAIRQAVRYAADSITKPGTQSSFAGRQEFAAWLDQLERAETREDSLRRLQGRASA